jgi:hypothetical protein
MRRRTLVPTAREFREVLAARWRAEAELARLVLPELGGEELLEEAELAAEQGESVAAFLERLGPKGRGPYLPRVVARVFGPQRALELEARRPVLVASWELPREHPAHEGTDWYVLEPDGSLTARE